MLATSGFSWVASHPATPIQTILYRVEAASVWLLSWGLQLGTGHVWREMSERMGRSGGLCLAALMTTTLAWRGVRRRSHQFEMKSNITCRFGRCCAVSQAFVQSMYSASGSGKLTAFGKLRDLCVIDPSRGMIAPNGCPPGIGCGFRPRLPRT